MKRYFAIAALLAIFITACDSSDDSNDRNSWVKQSSPTSNTLNAVHMISSTSIWAVGNSNTVINTTDGITWISDDINDGNQYNFLDVSFADSQEGIISGQNITDNTGVIFYTRNGGTSWSSTDFSAQNVSNVQLIQLMSNDMAYAIADNKYFLKSADAGQNWSFAYTFTQDITDLYASSSNIWVSTQEGNVFYSSDAGSNWIEQTVDEDAYLNSVFFVTNNIGYASTAFGVANLYKTTDGGNSWTLAKSFDQQYISKIFFNDANDGFVIAEDQVYYTTNGETWGQESINNNSPFTDISFNSGSNGYIVGYSGTILHYE